MSNPSEDAAMPSDDGRSGERVPNGVPEDAAEDVKRGRDGRRMNPRSLANLRPGAGAWRPGASPHLKHGLDTRRPSAEALDPALDAVIAELQPGLPAPLLDEAGEVAAWARETVWSLAVLKLIVLRASRYIAQHGEVDDRGRLRPELEGLRKATESYRRALDGEAMTLRSRLRAELDNTRRASVAQAMSEPDPVRRRALYREAGLELEAHEDEEGGDGRHG